ncbi:hypothetical protein BHE74_00031261 [Ensete ventricosum]|nr:hypothetical protein BHE74_00031261 [Ensete ventricosum]
MERSMARLRRWFLASTTSRGSRARASLMSMSYNGSYRSSYRRPKPKGGKGKEQDQSEQIQKSKTETLTKTGLTDGGITVFLEAIAEDLVVLGGQPVAARIDEPIDKRRRHRSPRPSLSPLLEFSIPPRLRRGSHAASYWGFPFIPISIYGFNKDRV